MTETTEEETKSIREMCDAFGVTPRTLRFYEAKELLFPQRDGQKRLFTKRDGAAAMTKAFSYLRRAALPKWAGGRLLDGSEEMSPGMQAALNCTETSLRR